MHKASAARRQQIDTFSTAQATRGSFMRGLHNLKEKLTPKMFGGMHTADRLEANRIASTTGRRGAQVLADAAPGASKTQARAETEKTVASGVGMLSSAPVPGASLIAGAAKAGLTADAARREKAAAGQFRAQTAVSSNSGDLSKVTTSYQGGARADRLEAQARSDMIDAGATGAKTLAGEVPLVGGVLKAGISGAAYVADRENQRNIKGGMAEESVAAARNPLAQPKVKAPPKGAMVMPPPSAKTISAARKALKPTGRKVT